MLTPSIPNTKNIPYGVFLALLTCICWMPLYVAPKHISPYGPTDLVVVRIFLATILILTLNGRVIFVYSWSEIKKAIKLSFLSTTGYYAFLSVAVFNTSSSVAVAVIGLISVTTLVGNNIVERKSKKLDREYYDWSKVGGIAFLGFSGSSMFIIYWIANLNSNTVTYTQVCMGIGAAIAALMSWTSYRLLNRSYRDELKVTKGRSDDWSDLTTLTAICTLPPVLIVMLLLTPVIGSSSSLFTDGINWEKFTPLLKWALLIAVISTFLGFRLYNRAETNLNKLLGSQIVTPIVPLSVGIDVMYGKIEFNLIVASGIVLLMISTLLCGVLQERDHKNRTKVLSSNRVS